LSRDLFIVASPFQVISAIEAKHNFRSVKTLLIYFQHKTELENRTISSAVEFGDWDEVIALAYPTGKSSFTNSLQFLQNLQKSGETFRHIFVGDIFSSSRSYLQRVLASNLKKSGDVVLLDDGVLTTVGNFKSGWKRERVKIWTNIRWNLFFIKTALPKFSVFTAIDFEQRESYPTVFKNSFNHFQTLAGEGNFSRKEENIYFIGSATVETWKMSEERFRAFMEGIFSNLENFSNRYFIPHRQCSDRTLEIVEEIGFSILKLSQPIEFHFIGKREVPLNIASTTSTALLSLKLIFNSPNAFAFKISPAEIREDRVEAMGELYREFDKYLEVLDIN
jgi:hypothetical protein